MAKKKTDALAAVQSSDQVRFLLEPTVCGACEAVCWSVEGKARGQMGEQSWETALVFTTHQGLSAALRTMARVAATLAGRARAAEEHQYLLEHHPRLW